MGLRWKQSAYGPEIPLQTPYLYPDGGRWGNWQLFDRRFSIGHIKLADVLLFGFSENRIDDQRQLTINGKWLETIIEATSHSRVPPTVPPRTHTLLVCDITGKYNMLVNEH